MNKTNTARRFARRIAGLIMITLASTLLNGCIITQLLGGLAGGGGLLGNPGQIPPAAGPLPGPIAGPLPGPGVTPPPTQPGVTPPPTTPGQAPALVPLAPNLAPALIAQVQQMDVDIQNRQAGLVTLVRDRDEYLRRASARQQNDPNLPAEQQLIAQRNTQINTDQAALNEIIARRNKVASGQPA